MIIRNGLISHFFYTCFPSVTDESVAPKGKENAFFLIPLAPGIEDSQDKRDQYFNKVMLRLEQQTNQSLKEHVVYKKSFCLNDFKADYNSYKGNAYGMANTLRQTAFLRPKIKSKKSRTALFYWTINRSRTWSTTCIDIR